MIFETIRTALTDNKSVLSGNELSLYLMLRRYQSGTIKIEGRHLEFGHLVPYYDTITFTNGTLQHVSYAPIDLSEYEETPCMLKLVLDNVDVSSVVQRYLKEKGGEKL